MRNCVRSIAMTAILLFAALPTMAGEKLVSFRVSPGNCRVIGLPVVSGPIQVLANQFNAGSDPGVANVTLFRDTADTTLVWVGMDDTSTSVLRGNGVAAGTHIASLDYAGAINLEVQGLGHVRVCNSLGTGGVAANGTVALFW